MKEEFFYIQGCQPKGGKRVLMGILWFLILFILIVLVVSVVSYTGSVPNHYYLYIGVIILWLIASPFVKPKGVVLSPRERKLKLVSFLGNVRLSGADFRSVVSIKPIENTKYKLIISLVDGTQKYLSIEERSYFIERFEALKG